GLYNKNQEEIFTSLKEYSAFILERDRRAISFLKIVLLETITIIRQTLEMLEWFNFKNLKNNSTTIKEQKTVKEEKLPTPTKEKKRSFCNSKKNIAQILINKRVLDLSFNKLEEQIKEFIEKIKPISSQKVQTKKKLAKKFILTITETTSLDYSMEHILKHLSPCLRGPETNQKDLSNILNTLNNSITTEK
ncbi:8675_t:CDS:1, partial [Gigaspora rosea]